ncbi:DUF2946 domain-containing protein [Pseudomonas sp. NPDC090202]|uniref:DUF2946 domain-containing protein n=1 Tax=unclassified Pseudomonas TaxID=196821 RepID=UPI003810F065
MKTQQNTSTRLQRRRAFAWVACFALLFGMLAMPMTPTMPRPQGEQLIWGSFCTGSGTQWVATSVGLVEQGMPLPDNHAGMQHCPCCSGSLTMVAIPAGTSLGLFTAVEAPHFPSDVVVFVPPPRLQWPSLSPRASPRV